MPRYNESAEGRLSKDPSFSTGKGKAPEVGANDTEFESLLRRAADVLTSRWCYQPTNDLEDKNQLGPSGIIPKLIEGVTKDRNGDSSIFKYASREHESAFGRPIKAR